MKTSWWKLTIDDYPNYKPNDADLEHIAELIKQRLSSRRINTRRRREE